MSGRIFPTLDVGMTMAPDLIHLHQRKTVTNVKNETARPPKEAKTTKKLSWLAWYKRLPNSMRTIIQRVTFGAILITFFIFLIYGGPIFIIITMLSAQAKCFHEIISIAYKKYDIRDIASFRYIAVYFLVSANFYFGCENMLVYFSPYVNRYSLLMTVVSYHRFVSFCLHFFGVMWFVVSLKKKHYRKQFSLLAWTHVIMLVVVVQTHLVVKTVFQGMIWFIVCVTTITSNDIMAYVCGKLFGRTPLIQVSPKKTWEGFIGAAFFTVLVSCTVAYSLTGIEYFVCPIEYRQINYEIVKVTQCIPDDIFNLHTYNLQGYDFQMYPFVLHTLCLAIFGSLIAPFGGFFASGFKRAFKVKDFGDTIPGHGGIMDRLDCQLVMVTFVNVYISSFIRSSSADDDQTHALFKKVMHMEGKDQLELFYLLKWNLLNNGIKV